MTETVALSLLAALAAVLISLAVWLLRRFRVSPRERERRRRLWVNARGRITDGSVTEATAEIIFYSYSVAGVGYATSQDITDLVQAMPAAPEEYAGCMVSIKYATQNPANSIIICEDWTGLRLSAGLKPHAPSTTEPRP